jgi:hypothetical protein
MRKILDFLFGRDPDIFNESGRVQHKLPKSRWEAWENRFKLNPHYNWRLHTGTQAGGQARGQVPSKSKNSSKDK